MIGYDYSEVSSNFFVRVMTSDEAPAVHLFHYQIQIKAHLGKFGLDPAVVMMSWVSNVGEY